VNTPTPDLGLESEDFEFDSDLDLLDDEEVAAFATTAPEPNLGDGLAEVMTAIDGQIAAITSNLQIALARFAPDEAPLPRYMGAGREF
jgi:hypothetical protein